MQHGRWLLSLGILAAVLSCGEDEFDTSVRVADYLEDDRYTRLVFEVDAVEGLSLPEDVVEPFVAAAAELVTKPAGVELVLDAALPSASADKAWTLDELKALAEANFDLEVDASTVKIHVLLVDGSYGDSDIIGLAWDHRYIALFQDGLHDACMKGPGGSSLESNACRSAELGVLAHELGHTLGLVNHGVDMVMDHEDADHPHHSRDPDCVMYWAYERRAVVTKVQEEIDAGVPVEEVLGFCAPSLADLAAYDSGAG